MMSKRVSFELMDLHAEGRKIEGLLESDEDRARLATVLGYAERAIDERDRAIAEANTMRFLLRGGRL